MKITNGFISNSSSSSFIVVYDSPSNDEMDLIRSGKVSGIDTKIYVDTGRDLSDGIDFFEVTDEISKVIGQYDTRYWEFFKVHKILNGDFDAIIEPDYTGKKVKFFEVDYHSTRSLEIFKMRYDDENY